MYFDARISNASLMRVLPLEDMAGRPALLGGAAQTKGGKKEGENPEAAGRRMDFNADKMVCLRVPLCVNILLSGRYAAGKPAEKSEAPYFYLQQVSQDANIWQHYSPQQEKLHTHDYFELMCVFEGQVEQQIEKGMYLYGKGDAVLLNRNTRHYEILGDNYMLVFLCMSKEYVREMLQVYLDREPDGVLPCFFRRNLQEKAAFMKDYLDFSPAGPAAVEEMNDLLDGITRESLMEKPGFEAVVRGLVVRLLDALAGGGGYACRHIVLDSRAEGALFEKIVRAMEGHFGRLSRAELAETLNYNGDYLNRVIKKHTGMSFGEYSMTLRLKKADELISDTEEKITGIIEGLGFENRTHFYKLFSARHGMTPRQFRQKHRSGILK